LADALTQLVAVVRPRPDMDEGGMAAASRRLYGVLHEYPEDVAVAALDQWPRESEWFPTERELRDLLDRLRIKAGSGVGKGTGKGRSQVPVGMTKQFWERVCDVKGEAYAMSWLRPGVTAEFSTNNVYVNQVGHDRLWRDFENLIRETGVAIVIDPDVARLLVDYIERNGIGNYEPKRRRA